MPPPKPPVLRFEDPPAEVTVDPWPERLTALAAHPGQWVNASATFEPGKKTTQATLAGVRRATRTLAGRWEFRFVPDPVTSEVSAYVRYLGPGHNST